MWFKNLTIYKLRSLTDSALLLSAALEKNALGEHLSGEHEWVGWVSPRNDGELVYKAKSSQSNLSQFLLTLAISSKALPSSVVNLATAEAAEKQAEAQGFSLGRKAMKALKERIISELLPRAFINVKRVNVWIDAEHGLLAIDTTSPSVADLVLKFLIKTEKFDIQSLRTTLSAQAAMTSWIERDESPSAFTIDQDAKLVAQNGSKATVKYSHQSLGGDAQAHISVGKQCVELALTWQSKVSFVLTSAMTIKRIKPLDILQEGKEQSGDAQERFDSDFFLMTSELASLVSDLTEALGGFVSTGD